MKQKCMIMSAYVAILFGLFACGSGNTEDPLAVGQVLHRGNGGEPGTLDPVLAEDIHAFNVLHDLFEGLVTENEHGELIPGVAESWNVSDDGLTYQFKLRENATWTNGQPVVAADFVRTFRRTAAPDSRSPYAFLHEGVANFSQVRMAEEPVESLGVKALDDHSLEIQLAKPIGHWLSILAMPISFPSAGEHDDNLTNGPYKLISDPPGGPITLQKNTDYWAADTIKIDQVIWYPVADAATEFRMFAAGELDITHSVPAEQFAYIRNEFVAQLKVAPALALYYLAFDLSDAPFDDIQLRQALTMAIDREVLVSVIGRGEIPAFGVVPPGVANYDNVSLDWRNLEPDAREQQARDLYQQAGFSEMNPLAIKFVYDTGGIHEKIALTVAAMWRDVLGVQTNLDKREWQYFLETRSNHDEWDVMRFSWFGDYNAAQTFLDIFQSASEQNLPGFSNNRYDDLIDSANMTTVPKLRLANLRSAEQLLISQYPVAPLYFYVNKHLVQEHVQGFENNVTDRHPSRYLSSQKLTK